VASFNKFNQFVQDLAHKVHNLSASGGDTLRILLTNTAPLSSNSVKADLTEISAGNGYSAGGPSATIASSSQTSGTYKLVLDDLTITASGGSVGPFRYFVLYNDTPSSPADPLIGWWDYGSAITLADGESVTVDFSASNGALQIA
jgi:hypothetical protein